MLLQERNEGITLNPERANQIRQKYREEMADLLAWYECEKERWTITEEQTQAK